MADFPPAHPGEVLREDFLAPLGIDLSSLAQALGVAEARLEPILEGRRSISPEMALRLARYFGTTPEFWMGMQATHDLERARDSAGARIEARVRPRAA